MIISFLVGLVLGLVAGLLISRKHRAKLESAEAKGKDLLAALKGDK
jgi:NhaP-type Na+/H+ or K+/H+ antiporter